MDKVKIKEIKNHKAGRNVKILNGPIKGKSSGNSTKSGGIFRPCKGKP